MHVEHFEQICCRVVPIGHLFQVLSSADRHVFCGVGLICIDDRFVGKNDNVKNSSLILISSSPYYR